MGLLDGIYKKKYDILMNKIDNLNDKNSKGYKTFKEYVCADEIMKSYFDDLKNLESRYDKLHVYSYEKFESTVFEQLNRTYNYMLSEIIKNKDSELKKKKLEELKKDIESSYGHGWDKFINTILKDLNEKCEDIDRYTIDFSKNENIDFNYNIDEEPLYNEIVEFVVSEGKASASLLQRRFHLGYNRASHAIDLLEERGIIGPNNGSKPREVLVNLEDDFKVKSSIRKMSDKEYRLKQKQDLREKINLKDFMSTYGIDIDYSDDTTCEKISNMLLLNCDENDKVNLVKTILKYNSPNFLKLTLISYEQLTFNEFEGLPHLICPIISDNETVLQTLQSLSIEIQKRFDIFVEKEVKSISQYNNKFSEKKMSYEIIIVDEIFNLLSDRHIHDYLVNILLNCNRVGIKMIFFSKFNKKNLNLGSIDDLLNTYDNYNINKIFGTVHGTKSIDKIVDIDERMDGFDFEKFSGEILKNNGFEKVQITKSSNDFGVDIIAYKDDIKYSIQCKKYSSSVGISAVQEVIASKVMNDSHVAVVLTNNYFTKSAKELAKKNNVLLWDRDKLKDMIDNLKS